MNTLHECDIIGITVFCPIFMQFWAKKCCPYLHTLVSGSPIIQNGKPVGAVTHVLVAEPTEGYGIFIENMLSAAQGQVVPQAA